jgi:hypothetical protein
MRTKKSEHDQFQFLNRLKRFVVTPVLFVGLFVMLAGAASAYTVVFRDGQRIEVTGGFVLTKTTLTYEAAPGINKTLQLSLIDVAATERVNNQTPGSFFKQSVAPAQVVAPGPLPVTRPLARTLTNIDLEPSRLRRIESERLYEKRRIELGLPSLEETRRRQALEEESTLALARQRAADQAREEAYWRGRASALRGEIEAVDSQINYLQGRLGGNRSVPLIAYGSVATVSSFGGRSFDRGRGRNLGTVMSPRVGAPNQALINTGVGPIRPRNQPPSSIGFGAPFVSPYAYPVQPFVYGDSYERAGLSDNLNNLLVRRAGLDSLWRELEHDARIAKVPQVWLNRR